VSTNVCIPESSPHKSKKGAAKGAIAPDTALADLCTRRCAGEVRVLNRLVESWTAHSSTVRSA
jgi:hypothetical protein